MLAWQQLHIACNKRTVGLQRQLDLIYTHYSRKVLCELVRLGASQPFKAKWSLLVPPDLSEILRSAFVSFYGYQDK